MLCYFVNIISYVQVGGWFVPRYSLRQACNSKGDCSTFHQFQEDSNNYFLGTAEMLDDKDQLEPSYGGFVSSELKCM